MTYMIELSTAKFDVQQEPDNPINPIQGYSLLAWLAPRLRDEGISVVDPEAEDWGWYCDASAHGERYLIGAVALGDESTGAEVDWIVQIDKHRRFLDKVRGRNKLAADDDFCALVESIVRAEPAFLKVLTRLE